MICTSLPWGCIDCSVNLKCNSNLLGCALPHCDRHCTCRGCDGSFTVYPYIFIIIFASLQLDRHMPLSVRSRAKQNINDLCSILEALNFKVLILMFLFVCAVPRVLPHSRSSINGCNIRCECRHVGQGIERSRGLWSFEVSHSTSIYLHLTKYSGLCMY